MRNLNNMISSKKALKELLINYGFNKEKDKYIYEKDILNMMFKIVVIYNNNSFISKVIDNNTFDEYILVDIEGVIGDFVGSIKKEYEKTIDDIINKCFVNDIYKSKQSKLIINYIKEKYQSELEFLWDDLNAVIRNKNNNKWFILFMIIDKNKLGNFCSEKVEVINLKYPTDRIDKLVDNKTIFKGFHMSKKHWITIVLDEKLETAELLKLIDISYILSND